MGKRYIDCSARELAAYHKKELLQSIADSEGRVLAAETIGTVMFPAKRGSKCGKNDKKEAPDAEALIPCLSFTVRSPL